MFVQLIFPMIGCKAFENQLLLRYKSIFHIFRKEGKNSERRETRSNPTQQTHRWTMKIAREKEAVGTASCRKRRATKPNNQNHFENVRRSSACGDLAVISSVRYHFTRRRQMFQLKAKIIQMAIRDWCSTWTALLDQQLCWKKWRHFHNHYFLSQLKRRVGAVK